MNRKEQQMREEAREIIIETLKGGYNGYYCDILHEKIYTDCYIIGRHEAEKALQKYGVFEAIKRVQDYEKENFGRINTDLSNPEEIINRLFCIIAEEVLYEMVESIEVLDDNFYNLATNEINEEILKAIEAGIRS